MYFIACCSSPRWYHLTVVDQIRKSIQNPRKALRILSVHLNNAVVSLRSSLGFVETELPELNEIKTHALKPTDISDHLETLFVESLSIEPRLIVELGVRGGESTFVLERVAKLFHSKLVSVDIEDSPYVCNYKERSFIREDDIVFAGKFTDWCKVRGVAPVIDVLFIDTSHIYEHTLEEIRSWFPFLAERSKVFFHDTNMNEAYLRKDHSRGLGWNNQRGVIRAIEEYFGKVFNEKQDFFDFRNGWLIKHHANCSGFTILEKVNFPAGK